MDNNKLNYKSIIEKLRSSGLRPTRQRLLICKVLFGENKDFHFTAEDLDRIIKNNNEVKISLATIYNTLHSLKKCGYLNEVSISGNKTYFDTNTTSHHHFYDETNNLLTDISENEVEIKKIPLAPEGKKIKTTQVLIRLENDNHNQN